MVLLLLFTTLYHRHISFVRFSAPVQTGREAHPTCCTMGSGLFPGSKAAGAWYWPSTHLTSRLKKNLNYTSAPPLGLCDLFYAERYLFYVNLIGSYEILCKHNGIPLGAHFTNLNSITYWPEDGFR